MAAARKPYGLFLSAKKHFDVEFETLDLKHRLLMVNWANETVEAAYTRDLWNKDMKPWCEKNLKPLHRAGVSCFVLIDDFFWYSPSTSAHYYSLDITGPYVMHLHEVWPLKKSYSVANNSSLQVMPADVVKQIDSNHPTRKFRQMFDQEVITPFHGSNSHKHHFLVLESIYVIAILQGKKTHENRKSKIMGYPNTPKASNKTPCCYCPFVSFGLDVTRICPAFYQTHRQKKLNQQEESQRQKWIQEYMERQKHLDDNKWMQMAHDGAIIYLGKEELTPNNMKTKTEGQLLTEQNVAIDVSAIWPFAQCDMNPYHLPQEQTTKLLQQWCKKWLPLNGGKISKCHSNSYFVPAHGDVLSNVWRFKLRLIVDVVSLPKMDDILVFALHYLPVDNRIYFVHRCDVVSVKYDLNHFAEWFTIEVQEEGNHCKIIPHQDTVRPFLNVAKNLLLLRVRQVSLLSPETIVCDVYPCTHP